MVATELDSTVLSRQRVEEQKYTVEIERAQAGHMTREILVEHCHMIG